MVSFQLKSLQVMAVLDVMPGTDIGQICRDAIDFSNKFNVHVNFMFNGVLLAVWPGRTFEDMMTFWNTKIGPK